MGRVKIDDWSGGITDHYINGRLNQAKELDNLEISRNKKPVVRPGSTFYDSVNPRIAAGNARVSTLRYFKGIVFEHHGTNLYYRRDGNASTDVGSSVYLNRSNANTVASFVEWNDHLIVTGDSYSVAEKIWIDDNDDLQARHLGVGNAFIQSISVSTGGAGVSYVYGIVLAKEYMVGSVLHVDRGPVTYVSVENASGRDVSATYPATITILSGSAGSAISGSFTEVYRTENGGTELKFVKRVSFNDTVSTTDTVEDEDLGVSIYTSGGVVDNTPASSDCKYLVMCDRTLWRLNILNGNESAIYAARAYQSLRDDPDACPDDYYVQFEAPLTGGGAIDVYPIFFTESTTTRVEGTIDNLGNGFHRRKAVSETVGCISHAGIVSYKNGLFFPGLDGFYFTDGYRVQKLSDHLDERYAAATETAAQKRKIQGALNPLTGRIYWTMAETSASDDNDVLWVLDTTRGLSSESCFTTWSSGDDFRPTAIMFIGGDLIRGDKRGYLFQHGDEHTTDYVVDTASATSTWAKKAVVYDYTSVAMSFGTDVEHKFIPKITLMLKNDTYVSLKIQSINNDSGVGVDLKEVRNRDAVGKVVLEERYFPKGSLRCVLKQVRFTNSDTVILASDDYGNVTVNAGAKTALLQDLSNQWPTSGESGLKGYKIYFANDGYTVGYSISAVSADTLTLLDPGGTLPSGSCEWEIMGKRMGERFVPESYTMDYEVFGEAIKGYATSVRGGNES
jgi:hypothetical protein